MTGIKLWRSSIAAILAFGWLFIVPENAYATCVNYVQSQAIAAAYEGDTEPTVHTMDTCGGDDVSYQIPIATTITFDGVQYSNIYATTNSVITFGQPDGTYWTYPSTPSISLYSMDWVSGWYNAPDTLNISYSEGGFQLGLQVIPFGQWNAPTPSNINIIVAITNTGGISVAYSYQGPEYPNLRTGVRLHSGEIISLEAWGATQIQPGNAIPTLQAEPVSGSVVNPTPTPTPVTPEQQQAQAAEATQLSNDIANINNLIAAINGDQAEEPSITPEPEPTTPVEPETPPAEDPDVIVEPEIITPDDPRFPDGEQQTEPDNSNPSADSDTTDSDNSNEDPSPAPSEEPAPQPKDTNQDVTPEPNQSGGGESVSPSDNNSIGSLISEEELKKLNKLIGANDMKLLAELVKKDETIKQAVEEFSARAEENADAPMPYTIADAVTEVQAENLLADPIGTLAATFTNIDLEVLASPSEWGKDMTDDQREKAQEVIIPVIIASNLVAAAMTRRK